MTVSSNATAHVGQPFAFRVEVTNTGQFPVTNIEVVDTVTSVGTVPESTRSSLGSLAPGAAGSVDLTFTPPAGSDGTQLNVSATVLGVGPVLPPVSATASTQFGIVV